MNFRSLREDKLKLSEEKFAKEIGEEIASIKDWEITNEVPISVVDKISKRFALDYNTIFSYEKTRPEALKVINTWDNAEFIKNSVLKYIEENLKKINLSEKEIKKYIEDLRNGINKNLIKPNISIVGRSDTGKSTLINTLIGQEKMPASWTPTTSIAVYIKHIKNKPEFIKDEVWVFADKIDKEEYWDVKKISDKEYCEKWKIAEGNVEILKAFGTRQGDKFNKKAGSAVIFIDAEILQNCDIIDLPGFGTDIESDDTITSNVGKSADILIYLSQANGFMRGEDINYLKSNISKLPSYERNNGNDVKVLENLFVVASQSQTVSDGNIEQLTNILKTGYDSFCKSVTDNYWSSKEDISGYNDKNYHKNMLAQRFYTYTIDIPDLCTTFNDNLKSIVEKLPKVFCNNTKKFIREYAKLKKLDIEKEIQQYEDILNQRDNYIKILNNIKSNEKKRKKEVEYQNERIKNIIQNLSRETISEYKEYYLRTINIEALQNRIKYEGVKNKKQEIEYFTSRLQDSIQEKCQEILVRKSENLSYEINKYIEKYSEGINSSFDKINMDAEFDVKYKFASYLAKIGIVGGLGAFLVGQAFLAFGGISTVVGLNSAIFASLFGPIGLAVGLTIAGILGLVKLFGGGWQKSVAKKLVKAFDDKRVIEKYEEGIMVFWEKTESAFDEVTRNLENEWEEYVELMNDIVNSKSEDDIKMCKEKLGRLKDFFDEIPS